MRAGSGSSHTHPQKKKKPLFVFPKHHPGWRQARTRDLKLKSTLIGADNRQITGDLASGDDP